MHSSPPDHLVVRKPVGEVLRDDVIFCVKKMNVRCTAASPGDTVGAGALPV